MDTGALAGARTGFSLTTLRVFVASETHHNLVLLSRSAQPLFTTQGVDVRPVVYSDHAALVKALDSVDTVLSVIGGFGEALFYAQLALLAAAKEAKSFKRFAPSEYAGHEYHGIDLY